MFSFNFAVQDGEDEGGGAMVDSSSESEDSSGGTEAEQVPFPAHFQLNPASIPFVDISVLGQMYRKATLHFQSDMDKDLDIVSGKYEGGYKAWECCFDLLEYMIQHHSTLASLLQISESCSSGGVLELGCGVGLPAIHALKLGFQSVDFCDLNSEVLIETTWPNVYLNCANRLSDPRFSVRCFAGDWFKLSRHFDAIGQQTYTLILASETLYSIESCEKLYFMLQKHLAEDGLALLGTKRFYFGEGLGGGTAQLESLINLRSDSTLQLQVVCSIEDGKSNIRDILHVTKKKKKEEKEGNQ